MNMDERLNISTHLRMTFSWPVPLPYLDWHHGSWQKISRIGSVKEMTKVKGNILYLPNIKQRFPTIDWENHVLLFYLQNQDFPVVSGYFSLFEFNHMPWNPGMCAYQWRGHQPARPARLAMPSRDVVFFSSLSRGKELWILWCLLNWSILATEMYSNM